MNIVLVLILVFCCVGKCALGQGQFDRMNSQHGQLAVPIFVYEQTNSSPIKVVGFGSGMLYGVPATTNVHETRKWISVVTAKHILTNGATGRAAAGILVKIDMRQNAEPRYVQIPLRHDSLKNYWVSPSGLDLCLIPIPPQTIKGSPSIMLQERQIATYETHKTLRLDPGLVVEAISIQPEYLDPIDIANPRNVPTIRYGNISRIGFTDLPDGTVHTRPHVIDMHAGPGNSGAAVIVYVPCNLQGTAPGVETCKYMFLGVVMGFRPEQGSYVPYDATVTNRARNLTLNLVSTENATTNAVALSVKTIANPDLAHVVPAHELAELRESDEFARARDQMWLSRKQYRVHTHEVLLPTEQSRR